MTASGVRSIKIRVGLWKSDTECAKITTLRRGGASQLPPAGPQSFRFEDSHDAEAQVHLDGRAGRHDRRGFAGLAHARGGLIGSHARPTTGTPSSSPDNSGGCPLQWLKSLCCGSNLLPRNGQALA